MTPFEQHVNYTFDRNTSWHAWVEAYDGVHPLADRGAAYGTNTTSALQRAPVVAIDMDIRHLDILRERTPPALRPPLETISASYPTISTMSRHAFQASWSAKGCIF